MFTTIQKFYPEDRGDTHPSLSERRNIVVIADEAHRSQYDFIDGFARHMRDALPNASFVGFTGTPIERAGREHPRGVRRLHQHLRHPAAPCRTAPRCRSTTRTDSPSSRFDEGAHALIDEQFEEATEGEEVERKERLKTRWAQLEAIVGAEQRVRLVAEDIVEHFEQRLDAIEGKAMVVCMSRRICIDLYRELVRLRPAWEHADDDKGAIKVVMTGSASDPPDWQQHIRNKPRREALAKRFRDAGRLAADRSRARHVADGVRRAEPAHDVRRQADARPRPDAGHRPRQPRVQGQARRPRGRLPRARRTS